MIPFNITPCGPNAYEYVKQAIDSRNLAGDGPFALKCQSLLENKIHSQKFFLTPSGTASLEFACVLANIGPGDEVIMPSFTFTTTAASVVQFGGVPVFIDVDPTTMCMNAELIEQAITNKTKAIMPVHYAGVACEMDTIMEIAKRHHLLVIEDAAQVLNAKYKGKYLGTIGDIGCFSFHGTKNYAMGEGGGISINNPELIERAYHVRDSGTDAYDFERGMVSAYTWVDKGSSYLPSELQAAYLLAQLEIMDDINEDRRNSFYSYMKHLTPLKEEGKLVLPFVPEYDYVNGHMFYIKAKNHEEREALRLYLKEKGISAVFHYQSLHLSAAGKKYGRFAGEDVYTTVEHQRLLRLPMYYGLKEDDIQKVCDAIQAFYKGEKS